MFIIKVTHKHKHNKTEWTMRPLAAHQDQNDMFITAGRKACYIYILKEYLYIYIIIIQSVSSVIQ